MSSLDELIVKARHLLAEGHSPGQIADELSLSQETVTWLLTQKKGDAAPKDVSIDWTAVSSNAVLLDDAARLMLDRCRLAGVAAPGSDPGNVAIVGIAVSGVPLATLIAREEGVRLAVYHPAKHSSAEKPTGSMAGNFPVAPGERCIVVDDVITSGRTMQEVVDYLRRQKATPVAICVLFDKRGLKEVDGVPVHSVFRVSRID
ncbi:MAG: orotate phosphoribosyltransferase-like protein [Methanospirillum sp.]|nr:orotate phosphoribosyltransferase-like protein [Methanospirillum sp.]